MPDPTPLVRHHSPSEPAGFSMDLVRARLSGRLPRRATLDSAMSAVPELADPSGTQSQRRAAVAAILRASALGPEILFIRRAEHPNDPWSGHMAFPGGREEPQDTSLIETAIRETREELALDLEANARLIGCLDELPAIARGKRTGLTIAPFVFELSGEVTVTRNYEVAETLWTPLEPLFHGLRATKFPYEIAGQRVELPAHDVDGRIVWGLTHRMLEMLFAQLR